MSDPRGHQLWSKDLPLDALVHRFTVGDDPELDLQLLPWDCVGSAAHARMLAKAGLLPEAEARALVDGLRRVKNLVAQGALHILPEQEDGHTAIEAELTRMLGETGKRIHLGRSRNDQVALALRLLMRNRLLRLGEKAGRLAEAFLAFARAHRDLPLPGYTHLRRAMPSSWGNGARPSPRACWRSCRPCRSFTPAWTSAPWARRPASGCPCPWTGSGWPPY